MPQFLVDPNWPIITLLPVREVIGRDDRIWTRDILYPKQTRYQAALHPFRYTASFVIVENTCIVFHIIISYIYIQDIHIQENVSCLFFFFSVSYHIIRELYTYET